MELKSLFLGLTFAIGIFALKGGVGLHYLFTQRYSLKGRILFIFGSALAYFFVFLISYIILKKINVIDYYNTFQGVFRSGMYIHSLMAVGLIIILFTAYNLQGLFSEKTEMTIMKISKNKELEIITKKGKEIKALKVSKEKAQGRGERLGTAYRLEDGTMVYVPE